MYRRWVGAIVRESDRINRRRRGKGRLQGGERPCGPKLRPRRRRLWRKPESHADTGIVLVLVTAIVVAGLLVLT